MVSVWTTIPSVVVKQLKIISLLICHCLVSIVNIVLGICQRALVILRDTNLKTLSPLLPRLLTREKSPPVNLTLVFSHGKIFFITSLLCFVFYFLHLQFFFQNCCPLLSMCTLICNVFKAMEPGWMGVYGH